MYFVSTCKGKGCQPENFFNFLYITLNKYH